MTDKRESILLRLLEILGTIDGIDSDKVFRNRIQFGDTKENLELPCLVLLDGSETTLTQNARNDAVRVMLLVPQIFVVLKPTDDGKNTGVGELLSTFRVKIIKAILQDGTLADLLGVDTRSGYIEYRGIISDLQTGSSVEGQLQMDFAFAYTFNPNKL